MRETPIERPERRHEKCSTERGANRQVLPAMQLRASRSRSQRQTRCLREALVRQVPPAQQLRGQRVDPCNVLVDELARRKQPPLVREQQHRRRRFRLRLAVAFALSCTRRCSGGSCCQHLLVLAELVDDAQHRVHKALGNRLAIGLVRDAMQLAQQLGAGDCLRHAGGQKQRAEVACELAGQPADRRGEVERPVEAELREAEPLR